MILCIWKLAIRTTNDDLGALGGIDMRIRGNVRWKNRFSVKVCLMAFFCLMLTVGPVDVLGADGRGIHIKTQEGETIPLYGKSYALLIGISDYTSGWPDLQSVRRELAVVEKALIAQGFEVEKHEDPNGEQLKKTFEDFIGNYGYDRNNRLLFFFSGHGYTLDEGEKGYLVPSDAPNPRTNPIEFLRKALAMDQIISWSRQMFAKHALFLFDSCFSGTVFKAKDLPETPPHITRATALPVRQYLTAGDAGESVPAKSVFTPALVDALQYGWGDLNKDGYVSGTELGLYLQQKVPRHSRQSPQFGKIKDYDLSRGDFIFVAGSVVFPPEPKPEEPLTGSVRVETRPPGAKVYVDGGYAGSSPATVTGLNPGTVKVKASLDDHKDVEETVWIQAGKEIPVRLYLPEIITAGTVSVRSEPPGASWYLDGAYAGTTPGEITRVEQGSHRVAIKLQGHQDWEQQVQVQAGQTGEISAELIPMKRETRAGEEWREPKTGMTFVWAPGGCFQMGQTEAEKRYLIDDAGEDNYNKYFDDEKPRHEVCVDGFWMARHEVTVDQFREFVTDTDYKTDAEKDGGCYSYDGEWKKKEGTSWRNPPILEQDGSHPVACVSWNDAKAFAKWLSKESGTEFRLPTEAEWEYACRAGTTTIRFWGEGPDDACRYANVHDRTSKRVNKFDWKHHACDDGYAVTAPVGTFQPNAFGLYDMLGNVWEWCEDVYDKNAYSKHGRKNPVVTSGGSFRVFRGGSWYSGPWDVRCANRFGVDPGVRNDDVGFRLLRTP